MRSCSLYSGIVLGFKEKGAMRPIISGSRMARGTKATSKKEVEPAWLGLRLVSSLGVGLLTPFPGSPSPCSGFVVLVDLGNISSGLSLGLIPFPLWLPPVGYEPKLGSLRFVFRLQGGSPKPSKQWLLAGSRPELRHRAPMWAIKVERATRGLQLVKK